MKNMIGKVVECDCIALNATSLRLMALPLKVVGGLVGRADDRERPPQGLVPVES